VLFNVHKIHKV